MTQRRGLTEEEIISLLKEGFPLPPQERIDALLEKCLNIIKAGAEDELDFTVSDDTFDSPE